MWRRALVTLTAGAATLAIAVPQARGFVVGVLAASALWLVTLRPQILTGSRSSGSRRSGSRRYWGSKESLRSLTVAAPLSRRA